MIAAAGPPAQIGLPSVAGSRVAYAVAKDQKNKIVVYDADNGKRRTVMGARKKGLSNPSLHGNSMLYVRSKKEGRNELRLRRLKQGRGRPAAQVREGPDVVDGPGREARLRHDPRGAPAALAHRLGQALSYGGESADGGGSASPMAR